jgi:hypothetical protein
LSDENLPIATDGKVAKAMTSVMELKKSILHQTVVETVIAAAHAKVPVWFASSKDSRSLEMSMKPEATLPKYLENVEVCFGRRSILSS